MEKKIQFQKNADVLNEKGEQVGLLERVVLNPKTRIVTDLVVRTGTLFNKKEKVVPMDLVAATTEDLVVLRDVDGKLDDLLPFEEEQIVSDGDGIPEHDLSSEDIEPVIYGYPTGSPMIVPTHVERYTTQIKQNIPEGTVAMKEGAKVVAVGGKPVGQVESVLADPAVDQVTHLLISNGVFVKEIKLIPIQWVEVVAEDEVRLRVRRESVEEVADLAVSD